VRLLSRALILVLFLAGGSNGLAQTNGSRCLAIAETTAKIVPVRYVQVQDGLEAPVAEEVSIRFVGHSTFLITSPKGVTIATDYNGYAGGTIPRVVTMNHAHRSHYTDAPDPRIEYVLRGWNPDGGEAIHRVQIDDVFIRNVSTDIRGYGLDSDGRGAIPDGNSIFIFEVARLCIGHLGHLHQVLTPEDLGEIGQLDIVMAAVDGSYTMSQSAMLDTLKVLKARLVLPMHYFGPATLNRFLINLGEEFDVESSPVPEIHISAETLPDRPKVMVLPGY